MATVTEVEKSLGAYKRVADEKADGGDLLGALGLYFTLYYAEKSPEALADLADCYADMGLLELSNYYWFKYMSVTPQVKHAPAFEELGINYFYMDNLWASSYYFHKKVEIDGYISEDGLDDEIVEFFSRDGIKEDYYLAYPYELADYSSLAKKAKRAVAAGDALGGTVLYERIPKECRTEEIAGDYAVALMLARQPEKAISICRESIEKNGESVTAFCDLATAYRATGDKEKAEYYYKKAVSARTGDGAEAYKLATCAIEYGDDITANDCIKQILKDRPFDDLMWFFYGISFLNTGDIPSAEHSFDKAVRINPRDVIYAYYAQTVKSFSDKNNPLKRSAPLKYGKFLPQKEEAEYSAAIRKVLTGTATANSEFGKEPIITLTALLRAEDLKTAKGSAFILCAEFGNAGREVLKDALLDPEVEDEVKSSIIFTLIQNGYSFPIKVVAGSFYETVKPGKLTFANKSDGGLLVAAYSLAMAKSVFIGIEDVSALAFNANLLYAHYRNEISRYPFGIEDLSALMFMLSGFPQFSGDKQVLSVFGVGKENSAIVRELAELVRATKTEKMKTAGKKPEKVKKDGKNG